MMLSKFFAFHKGLHFKNMTERVEHLIDFVMHELYICNCTQLFPEKA